jgi:hypothetical protein
MRAREAEDMRDSADAAVMAADADVPLLLPPFVVCGCLRWICGRAGVGWGRRVSDAAAIAQA